ncbi:MAG: SufE family protein [Thermoplasmatota archaeon]
MDLQTLMAQFEFVDDWEDRYRILIGLGKKLPELPESAKTEENRVLGCQSQVWLVGEQEGDVLRFRADSDAILVRGLIALALLVYDGKTAAEIRELDALEAFNKMGLGEHLSPTRQNGFASMVKRIHRIADAA